MFQRFEPVAICDQFSFSIVSQLEAEKLRETFYVSLHCLIQHLGFNLIHFCQITINHYLIVPNCENPILNLLLRYGWHFTHISSEIFFKISALSLIGNAKLDAALNVHSSTKLRLFAIQLTPQNPDA
jgi:hypothetical protein